MKYPQELILDVIHLPNLGMDTLARIIFAKGEELLPNQQMVVRVHRYSLTHFNAMYLAQRLGVKVHAV